MGRKCKYQSRMNVHHRIVSRKPDIPEDSDEPFSRVVYNPVQFTAAMNKDQWVSYFACTATDSNLVSPYPNSQTQHNQDPTLSKHAMGKVSFFQSDMKRILGKEFDDHVTEWGITSESSAADPPARNGISDQKKRVLAMKAEAMQKSTYLSPSTRS